MSNNSPFIALDSSDLASVAGGFESTAPVRQTQGGAVASGCVQGAMLTAGILGLGGANVPGVIAGGVLGCIGGGAIAGQAYESAGPQR